MMGSRVRVTQAHQPTINVVPFLNWTRLRGLRRRRAQDLSCSGRQVLKALRSDWAWPRFFRARR
jgi:hypothetical protein